VRTSLTLPDGRLERVPTTRRLSQAERADGQCSSSHFVRHGMVLCSGIRRTRMCRGIQLRNPASEAKSVGRTAVNSYGLRIPRLSKRFCYTGEGPLVCVVFLRDAQSVARQGPRPRLRRRAKCRGTGPVPRNGPFLWKAPFPWKSPMPWISRIHRRKAAGHTHFPLACVAPPFPRQGGSVAKLISLASADSGPPESWLPLRSATALADP
jgi:hypothetical protein